MQITIVPETEIFANQQLITGNCSSPVEIVRILSGEMDIFSCQYF